MSAPPAYGPPSPVPVSKVELRLAALNLPNLDVLSKSDPQIFVFQKSLQVPPPGQTGREYWLELGRTEVIRDSLNPRFTKPIVLDYYFEHVQTLCIVVVDSDSTDPKSPLSAHDYLGCVETTLGNIVSSGRLAPFERPLSMNVPSGNGVTVRVPKARPLAGKPGTLQIHVEELDTAGAKKSVALRLRGSGLDKKDFFGKSDPFIVISKSRPGGVYAAVHQTEVVKNTLDPTWQPIRLRLDALCGGDMNRLLKFECFDWDKSGSNDLIGVFEAPLAAFQRGASFQLINPPKASKSKSYKNSGVITVDDATFHTEYSFLDFITTGTQVELAVAIDFTQSNGDPSHPQSLHYRTNDPRRPNEYQRAISSIGAVLEPYDSDKKFLAYGYGARLPDGTVSHFFPLQLHNGPEVNGVAGLLDAYNFALANCQLYGPTNFSPTINAISDWARSDVATDGTIRRYCILLIITDGAITDLDLTVRAIVQASTAPLSIIIVGVGGADFTSMDFLDSDDRVLQSGGFRAERDIVQFVPYRKFDPRDFGALSAATLKEVPGQFMGYVKKRGLRPLGEPGAVGR